MEVKVSQSHVSERVRPLLKKTVVLVPWCSSAQPSRWAERCVQCCGPAVRV